jgi:hypothetical protein
LAATTTLIAAWSVLKRSLMLGVHSGKTADTQGTSMPNQIWATGQKAERFFNHCYKNKECHYGD